MTAEQRTQVLDSAMDLMANNALGEITLEQLSRASGVAAFDIVRSFQSKENILKEVLERELELMAGAAYDPELRLPGETLRDELFTLSRVILDEYRRRMPLLRKLLAEAMGNPEVGALFYRTFIVQGRQLFTQFLTARTRTGELKEDMDLEAAAAMFLLSLTGAVLMVELFGGKGIDELDDTRFVGRFTEIFLEGAARR